ncbi:MAG TPA: NPCBM/NEW2 domain-containing protein, partial [Candidatus Limnocylindrales bacterium]
IAAVAVWRPWDRPEPPRVSLAHVDAADDAGGRYRFDGTNLVLNPPHEAGKGSVYYELGGRYTTLDTAVALVPHDSVPGLGETVRVQITVDGTVEYEAEIVLGEPPRPVKLTIGGAKQLKLDAVEFTNPNSAARVVWTDPGVR